MKVSVTDRHADINDIGGDIICISNTAAQRLTYAENSPKLQHLAINEMDVNVLARSRQIFATEKVSEHQTPVETPSSDACMAAPFDYSAIWSRNISSYSRAYKFEDDLFDDEDGCDD